MGDWPIHEILKWHFSNKQGYKCHKEHTCGEATQDKGKGKATTYDIGLDDWYNFGSDMDVNNEGDEEAGEEDC